MIMITDISISSNNNFSSTSMLCKGAKGIVACISPEECEILPDLQHKQNPAKHFIKRHGGKVKHHLLFDQEITTSKHGTKPMPKRRGARYETNTKIITLFGLTVAEI